MNLRMSLDPRLSITQPRTFLRQAWTFNRPLTLVGTLMLLTLAGTLVGLIVDPRVITGAPAWLKPAKFAISIAIYCFTLLWFLTFIRGRRRAVWLVSWVTAVALGIEMVLIAGAALFGTTSHFNVSNPISSAVWTVMGTAIVVTWTMSLMTIVLLLIQRMPDPAFAWALRLGLVGAAVGMAVAFFMTAASPEQLEVVNAGGEISSIGAHSVGVQDGGPGMPVTNWSTTGGDLRAPHFVGLYALQIVPLVGFLIARFSPEWLHSRHRVALVWTAGLTYLSLIGMLLWQALRGQPVTAPDALSIGTLLLLFVGAGAIASVIVLHGRRRARSA